MREIKFRAYMKDWDDDGGMFYDIIPVSTDFMTWLISFDGDNIYDGDFKVGEDIELMQFTGMTDRNNTDVYEGDILQQYWRGEPTSIVVVEYWEHGFYGNDTTRTNYDSETSEVIGNIYEDNIIEDTK